MSVAFEKGVRVRLDVSTRPDGNISVEAWAPVDDSPAPEARRA